MKVYFTASLRGAEDYRELYKNIFEEIRKAGYIHLDEEIFQLHSTDYYKELEKKGRDAYVDLYKRKVKSIQSSDICIFECSMHSLSIGFQIQKALEYNKPVVALHYKNDIPHFLSGIHDDKLLIREYDEKNLKKVIKQALNDARERRDKRFNFFISPKLLSYLEDTSKKEGLTKSKFIRNLIVDHMRNQEKTDDIDE